VSKARPLTQIALSRGPMAAFVAMGIVWGSFMACLPDLKAGLQASDGRMGVILIFGSLAAMAQMLAAPRLATHLGRAALPLGVVAMALAVALPAQAGGAVAFAGAMLAMGASSGATDVWMNARLATIEARARTALMNLNHAVYSFAYGGTALTAGAARAAGLAPDAILLAAALAVAALALAAWERDGVIEGMDPSDTPGTPARGLGPVPWIAGALVLTAFLTENAAEAWSALYIERDLGAPPGAGAAGPAILGLTMGVGRLLGQAVAFRVRDQTLLRGGLILAALGASAVAVAPTPGLAYAAFAVMGLGVSVVAPTALAVTGRLADPLTRGRAIARATVIGYMGFFLGPPGMGLVAELTGLRTSYALIAATLLAALILRARLGRLDR
jgi:predicted MFS family arabinose efflux permease